jgi:signal transduction histidine kinase
LRTPLAIIRGEADVALSQDREPDEYRETLAIIRDEARLLSGVVEDMLALARADAGQRNLKPEEFYFNDLIEECVHSARVGFEQEAVARPRSRFPLEKRRVRSHSAKIMRIVLEPELRPTNEVGG